MWCWSRSSRAALVIAVLATAPMASAASWEATVGFDEWRSHVAGGRVLELDAVAELLGRFEEREGIVVTIRHPGGDAGSRWGVEFRDYLVTYGVPSRHMELVPGSGGLDILHVSLTEGG